MVIIFSIYAEIDGHILLLYWLFSCKKFSHHPKRLLIISTMTEVDSIVINGANLLHAGAVSVFLLTRVTQVSS
nr:hypothetical protein BCU57_16565 [Shewanella sp. 10N.286.48.B5]PMI01856.1 hypothetical protein BCU55_09230 [Shewanella sp. 10N.286.48.A6]